MLKFSPRRIRIVGATWLLLGSAACATQPRYESTTVGQGQRIPQAKDAANDARSVAERDAVFLLSAADAQARFRTFASERKSELLTVEGLRQLAWLDDDSVVDAAIQQLSHPQPEVVEVAALALAEHAPPASAPAKDALLQAFERAGPRSRPAIAWALAVLGERRALEPILGLYQRGQLQAVLRLDGGPAFTLEPIAQLLDERRALELARASSPELRRLSATKLAAESPRHAEVLAFLLTDLDLEVARRAASGVAVIAEPARREVLKRALASSLPSRRGIYVDGLIRGASVDGALALLAAGEGESDVLRWSLADQVFLAIRMRSDPRGGDALARFLQTGPHPHWETQAALALAEIGDLRAVPALTRRLSIDPLQGYDATQAWQARYARDDLQRVAAARALADLAELHPKEVGEIRQQSEKALLVWAKSRPIPHESALLALAVIGSDAAIEQLRRWADPRQALPVAGAQPPLPETWPVAESALRQLGRARRPASVPVFEKQLRRRPKNLDASAAALAAGPSSVLGMALRALGTGAADGVSASGDPRTSGLLLGVIEDPREHEDVRAAACRALVWVAPAERSQDIATRIGNLHDTSAGARFSRTCLVQALAERVPPGVEPALLQLILPAASPELQILAGRALGKRGLEPEAQKVLLDRVEDSRTMSGAGLALLFGADPVAATRTVAVVAARSPALRDELAREWKNSLGVVSARDVDDALLLRWVANARATARVAAGTSRLVAFKEILTEKLGGPLPKSGPHSLSRTVLRVRLWRLVGSADSPKVEALEALALMKERGALAALGTRNDALGNRARRALFEVDHPRQGPAL